MRRKGLRIGLLAAAIAVAVAVAVARNIAVTVARKMMDQGGPGGIQDRFMRMWDELPDEVPPKRFLAAFEGIRADVARIRELFDAKNEPDAPSESSKPRRRSGGRRS